MTNQKRTASCSRSEAKVRLNQGRAFQEVAEMVVGESDPLASAQVAAALAVLAGIAASDAACCLAIGRRSRSENHRDAIDLLATIEHDGPEMARQLRRLLDIKDKAHYGVVMISATDSAKAVSWSRRLLDLSSKIL